MSIATLASRDAAIATIQCLAGKKRVGIALCALLVYGLWEASAGEPLALRSSLLIMVGAIVLWAMRDGDELWVGLCACLALFAFGAAPSSALQSALGSELVWLMLGAFMLAGALQHSGTAQALCMRLLGQQARFGSLLVRLQLAIAASAFFIPSTSARAALFLPVFMVLMPWLNPLGRRAVRIVALLIPTQILLTAGVSLTGAGAHLVTAQFMQTHANLTIGALSWTLLALPVVAFTSVCACLVVLCLWGGFGLWRQPLGAQQTRAAAPCLTPAQKRVAIIAIAVAMGWMIAPRVDIPSWAVGLAGAVLAGTPRISGVRLEALVRAIDWPLMLFFAATMVLGEAMVSSGAAQWLAQHTLALRHLGEHAMVGSTAVLTLVGLAAHLWIPSRTARVIVLLPALVLPVATGAEQLAVLALICVQASGFCQTLSSSAKPIAVFSRQRWEDAPVLEASDLLRAAGPIGLAMGTAVMLAAHFWWPHLVGINL